MIKQSKNTPTPPVDGPTRSAQPGVMVRMYRPGFGNCLLLRFPVRGRPPIHMLIDCGVLLLGSRAAAARMNAIARDIGEATGGHLDVLVVTSDHWEHISGFVQAQEIFASMRIDELWLPWTQDLNDPVAQEIQRQRSSSREGLSQAQMLLAGASPDSADPLVAEEEILETRKRDALALVKSWARAIRYHRAGGASTLSAGSDGVRAYFLGPPTVSPLPEDMRAVSRKGSGEGPEEAFFTAVRSVAAGAAATADTAMPFDASLRVPIQQALTDPFFERMYGRDQEADDQSWRRIDFDWLEVAHPLATRLEADVNNSSLAMAIELVNSGRVLFFPSDAQASLWSLWSAMSWTVAMPDGTLATIGVKDLLRKTVLLSVSHHGSHSGTAAEMLDLMVNPELIALIEVDERAANAQRWRMPFPPLIGRLQDLTNGRVVRSDLGVPADSLAGSSRFQRRTVRETSLHVDVFISTAVPERDDPMRRLEEALRGPVLANYDGFATAWFTDVAGAPLESLAAGDRCELNVRLVHAPPHRAATERVSVVDGDDVSEVLFEIAIDPGSLKIDPARSSLVADATGDSDVSRFTVSVPKGHRAGPSPIYLHVFQKTQLLCVVRADLRIDEKPTRPRK
jgi:hypothetical protein